MRPHHRAIALLGLVACTSNPPPEEAPDAPAVEQPDPDRAPIAGAVYGPPPTRDDGPPLGDIQGAPPTVEDTDAPKRPEKPAPKR